MRACGAVAKFKREFDKQRQNPLIDMGDRGAATVYGRFGAYPRDELLCLVPASRRRPSLLKEADAVGLRLSCSAL
jgi:hypothetical protein